MIKILDPGRKCIVPQLAVWKCLPVGSRQRIANKSLNVSIGGTLLAQVNSVRYLGILIDSTLSWTLHISNVVSKVRSCVASIIRYGSHHRYFVFCILLLCCRYLITVMLFGVLLLPS